VLLLLAVALYFCAQKTRSMVLVGLLGMSAAFLIMNSLMSSNIAEQGSHIVTLHFDYVLLALLLLILPLSIYVRGVKMRLLTGVFIINMMAAIYVFNATHTGVAPWLSAFVALFSATMAFMSLWLVKPARWSRFEG